MRDALRTGAIAAKATITLLALWAAWLTASLPVSM
jgi:hypothetical protein